MMFAMTLTTVGSAQFVLEQRVLHVYIWFPWIVQAPQRPFGRPFYDMRVVVGSIIPKCASAAGGRQSMKANGIEIRSFTQNPRTSKSLCLRIEHYITPSPKYYIV
jgi:hypothetical protein